MKKKHWAAVAGIFLFIGICVSLWQYHTSGNDTVKRMCRSSVNAALEHFNEYSTNGNDTDYIAEVAEFRAYMTAYLSLTDEAGSAEYIWCNTLSGEMTLHPEKVKAHISEVVDALEYLAEDYDHPNGFNLINAFNNHLRAE